MIPRKLIDNIEIQRVLKRWTKEQAAHAAGIAPTTYGNILDGTSKRIFLDTIDRLCKGFGVEREVLLKDVDLITLSESKEDTEG
jgi:transcriptional regulator with XRE-family HTH domain